MRYHSHAILPACHAHIIPLPLFIAILLLGAAGAGLRWAALLDYKLLDVQFAVLRFLQPQTPQRDVVIVGIDESTVKSFAEPISLWHRHLGQFLGALASAKPAVLGIDIVLPERSYEAVAPGYDVALLRGLIQARHAYPLVLALTVDPARKTRPVHLPFIMAAGDGASGFALMALKADGVVRRFDERLGERGEKVPTLAGQIARRLGIEPRDGLIDFARGAAFDWLVSARAVPLVLVALALISGLAALSTLLLHAGWHLPVVWAALTGLVALGARNGYEALLQLREQRRLRLAFGGYVSPEVMREILAGGISPELGGVQRFVCIMFSDIRGYTTRSEHMTPEQVIGFLNRYFEEIVAIVHRHGGSVVSFMGDGIMAVFGAPNALDNACASAFEAGREMLVHVTKFNARQRLEGEPPVDIGVGLHAGEAVVGHIGSSARHDFSAIGDATNVASRIESLTKDAGYRLLCSRAVMERLPSTQMLTALGPSAIKGHSPVEVWGYDRV